MRIRHSTSSGQEKIELQMTPMIDIVFQLLIFFIMTFKIVSMEGDFNIKMPQASPSATQNIEPDFPPMSLFLSAGEDGVISGIRLNNDPLPSFPDVNRRIIELVGGQAPGVEGEDSAEIELEFDFNLHYEYVIGAITAVSGYKDGQGNVIKLIEKIRFATPDGPGPVVNE